MKQNEVITIQSNQNPKKVQPKTLAPTRILVPVDSSGNRFNWLAYTLQLAKAWNAGIHLYYIIDIDEIPDSASPFVIEGVMNRLETKASNCLESLRELIQETGVKVITCEFDMGRVKQMLSKKIESISPELIVAGRGGVHKSVLKDLVKQATCSVLILPEAATPVAPSSVLFLNDREDLSDLHLNPTVEIILRTANQLHILTTVERKLQALKNIGGNDFSIQVHTCGDPDPVRAAEQFVEANAIDMVCSFWIRQSFLESMFKRCIPWELASKLGVPVLVVRMQS